MGVEKKAASHTAAGRCGVLGDLRASSVDSSSRGTSYDKTRIVTVQSMRARHDNDNKLAALRNDIVGRDVRIDGPFGEKLMVYAGAASTAPIHCWHRRRHVGTTSNPTRYVPCSEDEYTRRSCCRQAIETRTSRFHTGRRTLAAALLHFRARSSSSSIFWADCFSR